MIEQVAIVSFAAWRTASLLATEDGPFDVFERVRRALGVPAPGAEVIGVLPKLVTCVWCVGGLTAAFMWALWQVSTDAVVVFAAWGGLVAIERWNRAP